MTRPVALSLLLPLALVVSTAQNERMRQPSLDDVLERSGQYAIRYGEALATVLADEDYSQRLIQRGGTELVGQRVLTSEIVFVRLVDSTEWIAFRNVVTVDGTPVPGSDGRLERLLRGAPDTLLAQVRVIARDSARYNIGPITREINTPTIALQFVHPTHQGRSRFDKEGEEIVDGERVWVIRYRERDKGGLISRGDGTSLQAEGRLWIVPGDGRVVHSTLLVRNFVRGGSSSRAEIEVSWRRDARLDLWVPVEMRERFEGPWFDQVGSKRVRYDITGVATYSNYRRFMVDVKIK